jgi:hypothetical protein
MINYSLQINDQPRKVIIETVKRDLSIRTKPMSILARYCPFCGELYANTLSKQEALNAAAREHSNQTRVEHPEN